MTTKTKVIITTITLLITFAAGRYSNRSATVQTKTETDKQTNTDTHKETTITKDRNGNEITKIIEDTKKVTDITKTTDQTVTPAKKNLINISALASLDTARGFTPVYGISANKEFLGPVTIGAFGLTNGVIGLSIGFNF